MGRAVVYDLSRAGHPVRILETDRAAAERVARRYGGARCEVDTADAAQPAADPLRRVRSIGVYNGGADSTRYASPLPFAFSPATVLDEFTLRPIVFERGRFGSVPPLSGDEDFPFELGTQRVRFSLHSEV